MCVCVWVCVWGGGGTANVESKFLALDFLPFHSIGFCYLLNLYSQFSGWGEHQCLHLSQLDVYLLQH